MAGFNTVLVPLDGSPLAERALLELELLRRAGATAVVLVRALDDDDDAAEAETYLREIADQLRGQELEVDTSVARGKADEVILAEVDRTQADVLAMATHGRSGLGRWLYGSVAERVFQHTRVPVLLTRAWKTDAPAADASASIVLVPLDGSSLAEAVLPVVGALATSPLAPELVLVRVVEPPQQRLTGWVPGVVYSEVGSEADQEQASDYLRAVAERLAREHGLDGSRITTEVRVGRSVETIVEVGRDRGCSLVCMTTRAQEGIGRVVGTVTDGVLRGGTTPLLLVPPS
jgi:nucleotide-binding universal stress UspA family protein